MTPADSHSPRMLQPAPFRGHFNSKHQKIIMTTCTFSSGTLTKTILGPCHAISKVPGSESNEFIWLNWNYAQLHKSPGVFYYTASDHSALFPPVFHGMFMFL